MFYYSKTTNCSYKKTVDRFCFYTNLSTVPWSYLTKGDAAYTLVQVAVNDLIILIAFAPIVAFLLGVSNVSVLLATLILSTVLFVVIPLALGYLTRTALIKKKGEDYFNNVFIKKFDNVTIIGLLLTLIILFSF